MKLDEQYIAEARPRAYRYQGQWTGTSGALAADSARLQIERRELMSTIAELEQSNAAMRAAIQSRDGCGGGGTCHAPPGLNLPDGYADCTLTPAVPVPEATFDEPVPLAAMPPEQLEAAWAGVRERQRQLRDQIRDPAAVEAVQRRVVAPAIYPHEQEPARKLRPGSVEFVGVLDEIRQLHLAKTLDYGVDEDALANIRTSAAVVGMPPWSGAVLRIADKMHRLQAFHRRGKCEFDGVSDTLLDIASYAVIALVLYREATCTQVQ